MIDSEMHALLSAYAAGTLTKDEEKRLFEKALNNQDLFDALACEESMRAALSSPLVRQQLLRTLNQAEHKHKLDPAPDRWLWVGLAASLFIGAASLYYWPAKNAIKPEQVAVNLIQEKKTVDALPELKPPPPVKKQQKSMAANQAKQMETSPAASPAPQLATQPVTQLPPPPAVKAEAQATYALADSAAKELAPSGFMATGERARLAKGAPAPSALISGNALNLRVDSATYAYAFLIDGSAIRPLPTESPLSAGSARSIPLGQHSTSAEIWVLLSPTEDPVLARALTGVLPLPNRPWIKLKANP